MAYNVKFLKGTAQSYNDLKNQQLLNKNTFYYVDEKDLYLGDSLLTSDADVKAAVSRIDATEADIRNIFAELEALQGGEGGTGSISQQLSQLREELLALISKNTEDIASVNRAVASEKTRAEEAEEELRGLISTLQGLVDDNETDIENKVSALSEKVTTNEDNITDHESLISSILSKISTLVGDDTGESIRSIAANELAKQLIPENAAEALNTLEELAAWIQAHPGDAATMNAAIAQNAEDIASLQEAMNGSADDLSEIQELIAALQGSVEEHSTTIEEHTTSLQEILDEANGLLAQSKAFTTESIQALELGTASKKDVEDFDAAGSAAAALVDAKAYTDGALTWGEIVSE